MESNNSNNIEAENGKRTGNRQLHGRKAPYRRFVPLIAALVLFILYCPSVMAEEEKPRVLKVAFPYATGINEVYELSLIHI